MQKPVNGKNSELVKITRGAIDQYANSMFRFEALHEEWIESCVKYLRMIFGSRLKGATVVDYAFGRGNWAVAFSRAGAKVVYAIDASPSNVSRLEKYCNRNGLKKIRAIEGNIVKDAIDLRADIIWVYGILHHIPDADLFLSRIARLAVDAEAQFFFYAYDKGSLRQAIVEAVRGIVLCRSEKAFKRLSLYFAPATRLRARDDLTAPYIRWYGPEELRSLLERHGIYPSADIRSFQEFLGSKEVLPEFSPHHLLCSGRIVAGARHLPAARAVKPKRDLVILRQLAKAVFEEGAQAGAQRKASAIGLFNTHFTSLSKPGGSDAALFDDFLFLLHCALVSEVDLSSLPNPARSACQAAVAKVGGRGSRGVPGKPHASTIEKQIACNRFRL